MARKLHLGIAILATAALAVFCWPVSAAQKIPCGPRAKIIPYMAEKWGEHPHGAGLDKRGGVIEILTSKDGRTWTMLVTRPDGVSCLVGSGEAWEDVPPIKSKGEGA